MLIFDIRFVWFHMFKNLIKKETLPKKIQLEYPKVFHPRIPRRPNTYRYTKIRETDRWPKKKVGLLPHLPNVDIKGLDLFQRGYVVI